MLASGHCSILDKAMTKPVGAPADPLPLTMVKSKPSSSTPKVTFPVDPGKPNVDGGFRPGPETHSGAVQQVASPAMPLPKVDTKPLPVFLPANARGVQKPGPVYPTQIVPKVTMPVKVRGKGIKVQFPNAELEFASCECLGCGVRATAIEYQDIEGFLIRHHRC